MLRIGGNIRYKITSKYIRIPNGCFLYNEKELRKLGIDNCLSIVNENLEENETENIDLWKEEIEGYKSKFTIRECIQHLKEIDYDVEIIQ